MNVNGLDFGHSNSSNSSGSILGNINTHNNKATTAASFNTYHNTNNMPHRTSNSMYHTHMHMYMHIHMHMLPFSSLYKKTGGQIRKRVNAYPARPYLIDTNMRHFFHLFSSRLLSSRLLFSALLFSAF
jgi:hypothetical protein